VNIASFKIVDVMIHDVPKGNDRFGSLVLSDVPITLDEELRQYFHRKIRVSLNERGIAVIADSGKSDLVRTQIARLVIHPNELVEVSKTIAERLNEVQSGRNPAGLLVVATGTVDGKNAATVLKLEREQGLRFQINLENGKHVVDVEYLRNLTLTDRTKVFKTSLLTTGKGAQATAQNVSGFVSDDQSGNDLAEGVATFFLGTFLGCKLRDSPAKSTLAFATAVDAFINSDVDNAELRGKYQVALLAKLQDQTTVLAPWAFARDSIDQPDRARFIEKIKSLGIDPDSSFPKETELVKMKGFKMTFDSGMVLVGSRENLEDKVKIQSNDAARPEVIIVDTIKALNGR
jgi:hypothetical protein